MDSGGEGVVSRPNAADISPTVDGVRLKLRDARLAAPDGAAAPVAVLAPVVDAIADMI